MMLKRTLIHQIIKLIDPCLRERKKKGIGLMKDELGGKIMTEFVALRPKTYAYVIDDDDSEVKKAKGTNKCVIKRVLNFNDYKNCLLNDGVVLKSQQRFKSEKHDVYTEEVNKIALSNNDDKRLQILLIQLQHILMEQVLVKYVKLSY